MQIHLPPPQLQTHTPPDALSIVNTCTSQLSGLTRQLEEMDDHTKGGEIQEC